MKTSKKTKADNMEQEDNDTDSSHVENAGSKNEEAAIKNITACDSDHDNDTDAEETTNLKLSKKFQYKNLKGYGIEPLNIIVDGNNASIGRVQIENHISMLLMFDIIVVFNGSTQNSAGNFFRDLSNDKKAEVQIGYVLHNNISQPTCNLCLGEICLKGFHVFIAAYPNPLQKRT